MGAIAVGAILALWRAVYMVSTFDGGFETVVSAIRQARVSSCTKAGAETECAIADVCVLPQVMIPAKHQAHGAAVAAASGWSNTSQELNHLPSEQGNVTVLIGLQRNGHRSSRRYRPVATPAAFNRLHCSCGLWCTVARQQALLLLPVTPVNTPSQEPAAAAALTDSFICSPEGCVTAGSNSTDALLRVSTYVPAEAMQQQSLQLLQQGPMQAAAGAASNTTSATVPTTQPTAFPQNVVAAGSAAATGQHAAALWAGAESTLQQQMQAAAMIAAAAAAAAPMGASTQGELHQCVYHVDGIVVSVLSMSVLSSMFMSGRNVDEIYMCSVHVEVLCSFLLLHRELCAAVVDFLSLAALSIVLECLATC